MTQTQVATITNPVLYENAFHSSFVVKLIMNRSSIQPEKTNLRGRITVWLTSCLFCSNSAALLMLNQQQLYSFCQIQTSQTGCQPYSDTYSTYLLMLLAPSDLCRSHILKLIKFKISRTPPPILAAAPLGGMQTAPEMTSSMPLVQTTKTEVIRDECDKTVFAVTEPTLHLQTI